MTLQAVTAVQTTPEKVAAEFADWYENVGKSLLFRFDALSGCEDGDEDDSEGSDLDGQELSEGRDQAVVQALASLSKEAELKQDIERLQECQPSALTVEPPDTESSHVQVVEDTEKAKATPSVQPATNMSCEHHGTQTLAEMLAMLGFDKFRPPDLDSIDEAQKKMIQDPKNVQILSL